MTYSPTTWSDEVPNTSPVKYTIRNSSGVIIYDDVRIDIKTTVTAGTPVNAANLNKIEQGIVTLENGTIPKAFQAKGDLFIGSGNGTGQRLTVSGGSPPVLSNDDNLFTNRVGWVYPAFCLWKRNSSVQAISSGVETIVNFDTSVYDDDSGGILAVTSGASWNCTVGQTGWYLIYASIIFNTSTDWANGEYANLKLFKNGSSIAQLDMKNYMSSASTQLLLSGVFLARLAANDYVDIRTLQNSGATQNIINADNVNLFSIAKLR